MVCLSHHSIYCDLIYTVILYTFLSKPLGAKGFPMFTSPFIWYNAWGLIWYNVWGLIWYNVWGLIWKVRWIIHTKALNERCYGPPLISTLLGLNIITAKWYLKFSGDNQFIFWKHFKIRLKICLCDWAKLINYMQLFEAYIITRKATCRVKENTT